MLRSMGVKMRHRCVFDKLNYCIYSVALVPFPTLENFYLYQLGVIFSCKYQKTMV